jgi:hypothetical protein
MVENGSLQRINSAEGMHAPRSFRCANLAARIAAWLRLHRQGRAVTALRSSAIGRLLLQGPVGIPPLDAKMVHLLRGLLLPEIEQLEKTIEPGSVSVEIRMIARKRAYPIGALINCL